MSWLLTCAARPCTWARHEHGQQPWKVCRRQCSRPRADQQRGAGSRCHRTAVRGQTQRVAAQRPPAVGTPQQSKCTQSRRQGQVGPGAHVLRHLWPRRRWVTQTAGTNQAGAARGSFSLAVQVGRPRAGRHLILLQACGWPCLLYSTICLARKPPLQGAAVPGVPARGSCCVGGTLRSLARQQTVEGKAERNRQICSDVHARPV
jgi:hypothetical protein